MKVVMELGNEELDLEVLSKVFVSIHQDFSLLIISADSLGHSVWLAGQEY
jgi:hypothetical protein